MNTANVGNTRTINAIVCMHLSHANVRVHQCKSLWSPQLTTWKVWELANLIWQNLTLQIQRWAAVASEMHGSMQAIRAPWAAMAINSAIRQSTNNENMRFHKNSLTNHFASSDLHQWEGRSFDTGGYWAWGPNVWWLALMMLSAPFFCALHANSTRAFPGILGISSGTNVCGGVTSASGASLASGHRTPINAVCSEWAAQQQQRCNDRCLTMQTRVLISSWEKLEEEEEDIHFLRELGNCFWWTICFKACSKLWSWNIQAQFETTNICFGERWETCRIFDCHCAMSNHLKF